MYFLLPHVSVFYHIPEFLPSIDKKINRCIHKYTGCTVLYMFIVRFHHRYLHSLRYHRYYPWFRYCPVYWYFLHFPVYQCFLRFLRNRCPHYVPVWNCYSDHRHCCRYCPAGYHFGASVRCIIFLLALGSLLVIRLVFLRLVFFAHLVVFFLFLLLLILKSSESWA